MKMGIQYILIFLDPRFREDDRKEDSCFPASRLRVARYGGRRKVAAKGFTTAELARGNDRNKR